MKATHQTNTMEKASSSRQTLKKMRIESQGRKDPGSPNETQSKGVRPDKNLSDSTNGQHLPHGSARTPSGKTEMKEEGVSPDHVESQESLCPRNLDTKEFKKAVCNDADDQLVRPSKKHKTEDDEEPKNLQPKNVKTMDYQNLKRAVDVKLFPKWKFVPNKKRLEIDEENFDKSAASILGAHCGIKERDNVRLWWNGFAKDNIEKILREQRNNKTMEIKKAFESK